MTLLERGAREREHVQRSEPEQALPLAAAKDESEPAVAEEGVAPGWG